MFKPLKILLLAFLLLKLSVFGQHGFQKVYDHTELDTFSKITDVYLDGDEIYFSGGGLSNNNLGFRFGKVDASGNIEELTRYEIPDHVQRALYSNVDTDTNFRGNLVNCYPSKDQLDETKQGIRLIEYDLNGDIVFDTLYSFLYEVDSLKYYDHSKLVHIYEDSTYLINCNHNNTKESSPNYHTSGTTLMRVSYIGDVLWTRHYYNDVTSEDPSWLGQNIRVKDDTIYFHVLEKMQYGGSAADQSWAQQVFLKLDMQGNILNKGIFSDGQNCIAYNSSMWDEESIYLQYYDSKVEWNGNTPYYLFLPVLAKLDNDYSIVWRRNLFEIWNLVQFPFSMQSLEVKNDSMLIGAHFNIQVYDSVNDINKGELRLFSFNSNDGSVIWYRDYHYYPLEYDNKSSIYQVSDLELMPDGGFVLGGDVNNLKFSMEGKPHEFSYLLRTNCLGFLSPPIAQFSYSNEENEVLFINNSMNGGSYSWYFGDGDTLLTGEGQDSVYHTYEYGGDYDVTLIGNGCNGEADTVRLTINVEQGAYGNIGDDYFTIYPNPIENGGLITVETGNVEEAKLLFFDAQGRKVKEVYLLNEKSIYFIEQDFAAGTYSVHLIKDGKVVQDEKLVVR